MTNHELADLFTDLHLLKLLQLWTRRSMAERASRPLPDGGSERMAGQEISQPPTKWRLVPEGIQLYEWQEKCLKKWLPVRRGTVKVATGGGKTLLALAAAQALQNEHDPDLRLVIVVPTIPLMHQWHDEVKRGNVPEHYVGLMGGGREVPPPDAVRILICVINSARDRLPDYVRKGGWSEHLLLVVDECHRASAEQARRIFASKPRYTLGLSATPEQEGIDEGLPSDEAYARGTVGRALGPIVFDFSLRASYEAGLLTPFEVWHVGLPLNPAETTEHAQLSREISDLRKELQPLHGKSRSRQGFLAWCQTQASRSGQYADLAERFIGLSNRRKDLLYRAESRISAVLALLKDAVTDPESRVIVFHERIAEIERIYLLAEAEGLPVVLEHSELPDGLRVEAIGAFRSGVARVVISAKSLIEGFNVPSADVGIIAASSSSVRQRIQSLGRMLRQKEPGRVARIVVLYVADTEDEAIYEKADWENVIGAERNRYWRWRPGQQEEWADGLIGEPGPPRLYRPAASEVPITDLKPGAPYPGQTHGRELRVDQEGNLRFEDDTLVRARRELIDRIIATSPFRRARLTPAGHVICRTGSRPGRGGDWQYVGTLALPRRCSPSVTRYAIVRVSGRRAISKQYADRGRLQRFACGPAHVVEDLLQWMAGIERERGYRIRHLYWDGNTKYWVEIGGNRVEFKAPLPALEFPE